MKSQALRKMAIAMAITSTVASGRVRADQIGTIWVLALENHNWTQPNPTGSPQQIYSNTAAPYINSLVTPGHANAAQSAYATSKYHAGIGVHPSETNYVWAEAGTDFGNHTNADPSAGAGNIYNVPHLTQQLNAKGISWRNYQEDVQYSTAPTISANGNGGIAASGASVVNNPYYHTKQYDYAVKHNPMAFFADTANQNVRTFTQLSADIASNNFGRYNWITPNQYNDMHSPLSTNLTYAGTTYTAGTDQQAVAQGDSFLSQIIPAIQATAAYQNNGAIIIWFDETVGGDTPTNTIGEIVLSPLAKGNAFASNVVMSHSSDLKTMEELMGLPFINNPIPASETNVFGTGYNTVSSANDLSSLFVPNAIPEPTTLSLVGISAMALLSRRRRRMVTLEKLPR